MADDAVREQTNAEMNIHTIPMEFYGGKNPAPTEIPTEVGSSASQIIQPHAPIVPKLPTKPLQPVVTGAGAAPALRQPAPAKRAGWVIPVVIVGVLLLGGGGFGAWWFLLREVPQQAAVVPPPPIAIEAPVVIPAPEILPEPEPPKVEEKKLLADILIPAHTFRDSVDSDTDSLTDIEEELWGTDSGVADSDKDGYSEYIELTNLYNPRGVAPQRLLDAGLVSSYVNPEYQYTMYYPNSWLYSSVDAGKKEVLFTSITQEYIQVTVLPYPTEDSFPQWFAKTFPGEQLNSYVPFVNKFKVSGVLSSDGTVAVITDGSHVYLLTYNGGTREEINYRATFRMMVQSFKTSNVTTPIDLLPKGTLSSVPSLPVLTTSSTPVATSTSVITSDEIVFVSTTPSIQQ